MISAAGSACDPKMSTMTQFPQTLEIAAIQLLRLSIVSPQNIKERLAIVRSSNALSYLNTAELWFLILIHHTIMLPVIKIHFQS